MITNKTKSVVNIETKVAVLLFALGRLQRLLSGIHEERTCRWISTKELDGIKDGLLTRVIPGNKPCLRGFYFVRGMGGE
jgi:hypothetical protein